MVGYRSALACLALVASPAQAKAPTQATVPTTQPETGATTAPAADHSCYPKSACPTPAAGGSTDVFTVHSNSLVDFVVKNHRVVAAKSCGAYLDCAYVALVLDSAPTSHCVHDVLPDVFNDGEGVFWGVAAYTGVIRRAGTTYAQFPLIIRATSGSPQTVCAPAIISSTLDAMFTVLPADLERQYASGPLSTAGAYGLMQIRPFTARQIEDDDFRSRHFLGSSENAIYGRYSNRLLEVHRNSKVSKLRIYRNSTFVGETDKEIFASGGAIRELFVVVANARKPLLSCARATPESYTFTC
jgi:hypothetical protein